MIPFHCIFMQYQNGSFLFSPAKPPVLDYNVQGFIIFQSGSSADDISTQCFTIGIINDGIVEDTEHFLLELKLASTGCKILGGQEVVLEITDDPTDGM